MPSTAPAIYIRDAFLSYKGTFVFNEFNLTISAGKCTALLGLSGVGKTTLLRLIANLVNECEQTLIHGKIYCDDNISLKNNVSYMAQTDLLLPWLNALDNALLGAKLRGEDMSIHRTKAIELFKRTGLTNAINKFPEQLSGGMRQRVALIRTLLEDKPIVLMDEPFSALDAITRHELQNLMVELLRGKTVLIVTHDPIEALRIADEVFIMHGQPAVVKSVTTLQSPTPRNISDKEVVINQEKLFSVLTATKEH